jgi:hypothetical protein
MNLLHRALITRYDAEINEAVATLNIYFNHSVGIGEHPQHLEEMDKCVEKMTNALDKKQALMHSFDLNGNLIENNFLL